MELLKYGIKKHPFLTITAFWLFALCTLGRFAIDKVVPFNYYSALVFSGGFVLMDMLFVRKRMDESRLRKELVKTGLMTLGALLYVVVTLYIFNMVPIMTALQGRNSAVIFFSGILALVVIALVITFRREWTYKKGFVYMFGAAFFFHLFFFICYAFLQQWDLGGDVGVVRNDGNGHLGYIKYLSENILPAQFDPRLKWQYYHPPLNHYLAAALLKIQMLLGVPFATAIFNLQFMPFLYCMFMIYNIYRAGREAGLSRLALMVMTGLTAYCPAFVLMGNYLNNDMLSVMFISFAIYYTARWNRTRKMKDMLLVAFSFGLGMVTKLSVSLAALPVGIFFIAALVLSVRKKDKKGFRKSFGQMCVFVAVAAPLSLYWSLRNYIRFGVPLGYVPVTEDKDQLITQSAAERLFDFRIFHFTHHMTVCKSDEMPPPHDYNDYNPLVCLFKTASGNTAQGPFPYIYWITIIMGIVSFACVIYILAAKDSMPGIWKLAMGAFYAATYISYVVFCFRYPNLCTEEIRYASMLIIIGAFCIGLTLKRLLGKKKKSSRRIGYCMAGLSALYCVISFTLLTAECLHYIYVVF